MGYAEVFGGALLFPSQLSYISISFSADVTLQWPTEQQIGGTDVVSDFMDMDATAASLNVDMPSASNTSTGNKATFNNIGSNSFTVRDSDGGTIQSVAPGEQWVVVLTDNTTTAGTWSTFQLGATVSVASASALAGAGIKAISTTLNQQIDSDVEAATPFTVVDGDRAKCLVYTAGAGTANLTAAATLGNDWFFMLRNSGSGTLNVLPPSGSIDGGASINLDPNDSAFIFTDGTDFFTVGLSSGSTIAFDFVSIAIPGSGDFTLSGANLNRIAYQFTGALTGARKIVVPNTTQQYWVDNSTTGAFALTIGTAAGASPEITQGERAIVYSDGTDVLNASTATTITFPVSIAQGGTAAITAAAALTNLGAAASALDLIAGAGLTGGGDLTADRTFNVVAVANGGILVNADDVELDITGMTAETTIGFDDEVALEDTSAGAKRKATVEDLIQSMLQGAVRSTTLSRASTTTLTDDPVLAGFPLQSSSAYILEYVLICNGNGSTVAGFKWAFDFNGQIANIETFGGSAFWYVEAGPTETIDTTDAGVGGLNGDVDFAGAGAADHFVVGQVGIVTQSDYVDDTAIDLQWAQIVSDATATRLVEGSFMRLTKVVGQG